MWSRRDTKPEAFPAATLALAKIADTIGDTANAMRSFVTMSGSSSQS
jgi:hypothetical protein